MKKQIKHTSGPWTPAVFKVTATMLERMKVGSLHHAVCTNADRSAPQEFLIALCGDELGLDSQSAADARLIAAAPDMLEAIEQYLKIAADGECTVFELEQCQSRLKQVAAKAQGGS